MNIRVYEDKIEPLIEDKATYIKHETASRDTLTKSFKTDVKMET